MQKNIILYIISTHQHLIQHYPDVAEFRKKSCQDWIAGEQSSNLYHKIHLPYIVIKYWDVWNAPVSRGMDHQLVSQTVLDQVRNEIIDIIVRMCV